MVNTLFFNYHAINLRKKKDKTNFFASFFIFLSGTKVNMEKESPNHLLYVIRTFEKDYL